MFLAIITIIREFGAIFEQVTIQNDYICNFGQGHLNYMVNAWVQ